jgi:hypothetical protein
MPRSILTTSQPQALIDEAKRQASAEGLNLSEFVGNAIRKAIDKPSKKIDKEIQKQVRYKPRGAK